MHECVGFRSTRSLHVRSVPCDVLLQPERHDARQPDFRQVTAPVEIGECLRAGPDRLDPFPEVSCGTPGNGHGDLFGCRVIGVAEELLRGRSIFR